MFILFHFSFLRFGAWHNLVIIDLTCLKTHRLAQSLRWACTFHKGETYSIIIKHALIRPNFASANSLARNLAKPGIGHTIITFGPIWVCLIFFKSSQIWTNFRALFILENLGAGKLLYIFLPTNAFLLCF